MDETREDIDATNRMTDNHRNKCLMEIRAGAGGEQAAQFAGDLFEMYKRFAESKGWNCETLEALPSEPGGFGKIDLAFEGDGCYHLLRFEKRGGIGRNVPSLRIRTDPPTPRP